MPSEQLPSIINALADYTGMGVPEGKLEVGIQSNAAVWHGGSGTDTGGVTKPKQTWTYSAACVTEDPGAPSWTTMPYRQMVATLLGAAGYSQHFDAVADQSWLSYDPSGTGAINEAKDRFDLL